MLPAYLWVLWDEWTGSASPLRSQAPDNFYELQARAMFHGHLNVPTNSLGIEGFIHDGRTYTYFGIFPSLIRMPFLLVTNHFDGRYTAPSLLSAWLVTALFAGLLVWRIRIMLRGAVALPMVEAVTWGIFMAAVMGGSVVVYLGANPSVYNEDFAWSTALTTGVLFALLGMLERPTRWRVAGVGALVLCTALNRSTTGYAAIIAAFLVAGWFAFGRGGRDQRRWALPVALCGLIPLVAVCAVTYGKFGLLFGLPMADQVWAHINAHRRYFLAANGGKAFSLRFLPSTLWAYLQPFGIRFSAVFPFVYLPAAPAKAIGNVVLDQTYATTSAPSSMPLLFLLSLWGLVTAFRPKPIGQAARMRLLLLAAGAATVGVFVWGYIADRYLADLMPLLIMAGAIGGVDLLRRVQGRAPRWATVVACGAGVLAVFSVWANVSFAVSPSTWFNQMQTNAFVAEQEALTPGALAHTVVTGDTLPYWAPAGTLFAAPGCDALYRSTGDKFVNSPGQQAEHATWTPVELGSDLTRNITFTFNHPYWKGPPVLLETYGRTSVVLLPYGKDGAQLVIRNPGGAQYNFPSNQGYPFIQLLHGTFRITVVTDPYRQTIQIIWYGQTMIQHYLDHTATPVVAVTPASVLATDPDITVGEWHVPSSGTPLCHAVTKAATTAAISPAR